jgi:hypothetical protein
MTQVIRIYIPNANLTPVQKEHGTIVKTHKQLNASKPIKSGMQLPIVIAALRFKKNCNCRTEPEPQSNSKRSTAREP